MTDPELIDGWLVNPQTQEPDPPVWKVTVTAQLEFFLQDDSPVAAERAVREEVMPIIIYTVQGDDELVLFRTWTIRRTDPATPAEIRAAFECEDADDESHGHGG